jgi:hypothetical protein
MDCMDEWAESDLAWELADISCQLISDSDRAQFYVALGAGYNYNAIDTLLKALHSSDLAVTSALAARLADWLSVYAHHNDAPELRAMIEALRPVS